jgi:murein DD-endopeptidase MepM/ murein hydrolase activator NlpD
MRGLRLIAIFACSTTGCTMAGIAEAPVPSVCEGYSALTASDYVLPFPKGKQYPIIQGNCAKNEYPWTHFGNLKYAYDIGMPIGSQIIAARSGAVVFVRDNFTDNYHGKDQGNAIVILQQDGTYALYAHLTQQGSLVKVGQSVKQGDVIARSGNSGESPEPHLHFQVSACGNFLTCPSLPVSFKNSQPGESQLKQGSLYAAK